MKFSLQNAIFTALVITATGCSIHDGPILSIDGNIPSATDSNRKKAKYDATLRFVQYSDQRQETNPRRLGEIKARVSGINNSELILDQDVAYFATSMIKNRFDAEGFQILDGSEANKALFEISGTIKEFSLDIKGRDAISIAIETKLTDITSGKILWSGITTEKNERFAGVSGNNKEDVLAYLFKELGIVSDKTVAAISSSLMASRPELFTLTPGTKPISGVDVFVAPPASGQIIPVAGTKIDTPISNLLNGQLSVNTSPQHAKVYVDGVYFGLSPLRAEIEPGIHDVVIKLNGYKTMTEKVSVRKGDNTEFELDLKH